LFNLPPNFQILSHTPPFPKALHPVQPPAQSYNKIPTVTTPIEIVVASAATDPSPALANVFAEHDAVKREVGCNAARGKVFISHTRGDAFLVLSAVNELAGRRISVWAAVAVLAMKMQGIRTITLHPERGLSMKMRNHSFRANGRSNGSSGKRKENTQSRIGAF